MSSPIDSNPDPDEREQEAASLHELAESIIVECKQSKLVSSLDTAIFLLGQVLDQQPLGHTSRSDTLRHLATGLLARFAHAGHVEDLDQALSLLDEASTGESTIVDESDVVVQDMVTLDHEEQVSMMEIAVDALTEFQQAGQLSSIESAVHLYREALLLQSAPNPQRSISLLGLATALVMEFYCEEKLHYLDEAVALLQDIQTFPQFQCLLSLSLCYCLKFMQTADIQDIDEAVDLHGKAADEDAEAEELCSNGCAFFVKYDQSAQMSDLNEAVSLLQASLLLRPFPHPNHSVFLLSVLADALLERHDQMGQPSDLGECISFYRKALDLRPSSYPDQLRLLDNFANALLTRFVHAGQLSDLDESISVHRKILDLVPPSDQDRASSVNNLADALWRRITQLGQLCDLEEYISLNRDMLGLLLPSHPDRLDTLDNLLNALMRRFQQIGQLCDLEEFISLTKNETLDLRPPSDPGRSCLLNNLVIALLAKFDKMDGKGQLCDLEESISFSREALNLRPLSQANQCVSLNNLGTAFVRRFEKMGQLCDLEESVSSFRKALDLRPASHPNKSNSFNNLGNALFTRFEQMNQIFDLEESISLYRKALNLRPSSHPERSTSLNSLANALLTRFQQNSQLCDLEESISLYRQALQLFSPTHPGRFSSLNCLANALLKRLKQMNQFCDLDESISLYRKALEIRPPSHADHSSALNKLADTLLRRFEQQGQICDLDESISLRRKILDLSPLSHPDHSDSLHNLADVLLRRFEQRGQQCDLEESIFLNNEALNLRPVSHPDRPGSLTNLANALLTRYEQSGQLYDLEESISLSREVLDLGPQSLANQFGALSNLANSLFRKFEREGQLCDLEESISFYRKASDVQPPSHQLEHFRSPNSLPVALMRRFEHMGQLHDLEECVSLTREALDLMPLSHPTRSSLVTRLSNALLTRFEYMNQLLDLQEFISLDREALSLRPPPHPDRASSLNSLAIGLMRRFQQMGQICDLEESISVHREALDLRPQFHPDRFTSLNNFASTLLIKFQQMGQLASGDLEESISSYREALDLSPITYPNRSGLLNNLGNALLERFELMAELCDLEESISSHRASISLVPVNHPNHGLSDGLARALVKKYTITGESGDMSEAIAAFHNATTSESSSILHRFNAAINWANHADSYHHPSALDAYQHAINLLPHLATPGMDLKARLAALSNAKGLACNAAYCAIQVGQLEKAVEFLSEGRGVFWTQALQLRTPYDKLQSVAPILAEKLQAISYELEKSSYRDSRNMNDTSQKVRNLEQEAAHCRNQNNKRNHTLDEIRELDGFHDFLLPKSFDVLQQASKYGPVVLLNASQSGCDGLILTLNGVTHVPFPDVTVTTLKAFGLMIKMVLSGKQFKFPDAADVVFKTFVEKLKDPNSYPERGGRVSQPVGQHSEKLFQYVLENLWSAVVHPIIQALGLQKSDSPLHLWWCPTGPFSFLPLHAAGLYDKNCRELEGISNYIISSYTLTLDAMFAPLPCAVGDFEMLTVIQPEIPGKPKLSLPFTTKELQKIEQQVPEQYLIKLGTPKKPTSIEKVLFHLSSTSIAHFACHGEQKLNSPLDSALLLSDGGLKISKIMEHPMPNASLAFLSACQTAMGDEDIPDEAMHIAATMLFAGFHGVVGTMWSINDDDAPDVAEAFYAHLFRNGTKSHPDTTEAAQALHLAVKKLRTKKNVSFKQWVPFIHLGI